MPLVYRVTHVTSYRYSDAVSICHNEARLTPRSSKYQRLLRSQLLVEPTVTTLDQDQDYFGNVVHYFALQEAHSHLSVTAVSEVDITPFAAPAPALTEAWETARERVRSERSKESLSAYELTFESPHVRADPEATAYALESFQPKRPLLEAALELTRRIHTDFEYRPGSTSVATPLRDVMKNRRGVCQDFTHLQIAMLPLRVGVHLQQDLGGPARPRGGGRVPRMAQRVLPWLRLHRSRPDQRRDPERRARHARLGP
jgi:transglutaminase-like putative cysteine protease